MPTYFPESSFSMYDDLVVGKRKQTKKKNKEKVDRTSARSDDDEGAINMPKMVRTKSQP